MSFLVLDDTIEKWNSRPKWKYWVGMHKMQGPYHHSRVRSGRKTMVKISGDRRRIKESFQIHYIKKNQFFEWMRVSQVRVFILTNFFGVTYFTYLFRSLESEVCQTLIKEEFIAVKCGSWTLDQVLVLLVQIQQKIGCTKVLWKQWEKKFQNPWRNKPMLESYTTSKDDLRPNGQSLDEILGLSTFHRIVKGYIH